MGDLCGDDCYVGILAWLDCQPFVGINQALGQEQKDKRQQAKQKDRNWTSHPPPLALLQLPCHPPIGYWIIGFWV